ncbi:MAG: shikimate kinase, partial [Halanaerobiaceae bacterium]
MNIVLIGMSGAGKSTLGVLLAKALGIDFIDTDIIIQKSENSLLQEIIDNKGIEEFLKIEEKILSNLEIDNAVIATGGSAVYSEKAMNSLKKNGQIVYLHVPFVEIKRRLDNIKTRGIVMREGKSLNDVFEERMPLYQKYADKTIDCSDKDIEH